MVEEEVAPGPHICVEVHIFLALRVYSPEHYVSSLKEMF